MKIAYTQPRPRHNEQAPRVPWELSAVIWLLVAVQARDERIRRLEHFNRSLAVELDRVTGTRAQAGRRAA
jgi:hypothetical protein